MENASKALLIAGAVLLVIALIAVAMGIFGTARGVVDQAEGQIDNMSVQMHNKQFEQYGGAGKSLQETKELISLIMANNAKVTNSIFRVTVTLRGYSNVSYQGTFSNAWMFGGYYDTMNSYITNYTTPGKDHYGGNTYSTGNMYDVKLLYNEKGIIYRIDLYRYI